MKLTKKNLFIVSGCCIGVIFLAAGILTIIQPPRTLPNGEYITKMTLEALKSKYVKFNCTTTKDGQVIEEVKFNTKDYYSYSFKDYLDENNSKYIILQNNELDYENIALDNYEDETVKTFITNEKNTFLSDYYIKNIYEGEMIQGLEGMYDVNYTDTYLGIYETETASYKYNFDGLVTEIVYKTGEVTTLEVVE